MAVSQKEYIKRIMKSELGKLAYLDKLAKKRALFTTTTTTFTSGITALVFTNEFDNAGFFDPNNTDVLHIPKGINSVILRMNVGFVSNVGTPGTYYGFDVYDAAAAHLTLRPSVRLATWATTNAMIGYVQSYPIDVSAIADLEIIPVTDCGTSTIHGIYTWIEIEEADNLGVS